MPSPVLLVHSSGFTSRQWRKLADQLAPRGPVLAPDLIGYASAGAWPVGEPFHFRQDVARLAGMLEEPAHVVGHSYGGLLALQLALARPELVRSIAVYEPVTFGVLDDDEDRTEREELARLPGYTPDAGGVDEAWLRTFVEWWNGAGAWDALPEATRQAFRDVAWKMSREVISLGEDRTPRATYGTIACPTLLLVGTRTPRAEQRVVQRLAEALPRAQVQRVDGAGHMGPLTHTPVVNAAIAAFIEANR